MRLQQGSQLGRHWNGARRLGSSFLSDTAQKRTQVVEQVFNKSTP